MKGIEVLHSVSQQPFAVLQAPVLLARPWRLASRSSLPCKPEMARVFSSVVAFRFCLAGPCAAATIRLKLGACTSEKVEQPTLLAPLLRTAGP